MSAHHSEVEIKKHVRVYMTVFAALWTLTVITVAVSYLDLSTAAAVGTALFIAAIKGSLVACYFMHLITEKRLIVLILAVTVLFFLGLLLLPLFSQMDQVQS